MKSSLHGLRECLAELQEAPRFSGKSCASASSSLGSAEGLQLNTCGLDPFEQREASRNTDHLSHARSVRLPPIAVSAHKARPSLEARSSEAETAMNGAGHGNRTHVLSLEG